MNPEYKNLTKIPYFRRVVLQNFPFIEEDFDALTDYGLLCKVVEYLNKIIEQQNLVNDNTNALYQAYITLKDYVDNYFNNLDVQEEINNKLDVMAQDGTLQEIIGKYIFQHEIDVKYFGAKGDGITDDTEAFKNAISFLLDKYNEKGIFNELLTLTITTGRYLISDTIEIPTIIKLNIKGDVYLLSNVSNNPTIWYNSGNLQRIDENSNIIYQQSFAMTDLIAGNGVLCIERNTEDKEYDVNENGQSSIAIEIGDRTVVDNVLNVARSKFKNIAISGFTTAIKINPINTYLLTFEDIKLERNRYNVIYGGINVSSSNSGENFKFINCTLAQSYNSYINYNGGQFTFNNCSFDFNANIFLLNHATHLILNNPHIENVGFNQDGIINANINNCVGYGTIIYANFNSSGKTDIATVEINNPNYYLQSSNKILIPRYQSSFNGNFPNIYIKHNSLQFFTEGGYTYENVFMNTKNVIISDFNTTMQNATMPVIPFNNYDNAGMLNNISNSLNSLTTLENNYQISTQNIENVEIDTINKIFNKSIKFEILNKNYENVRRRIKNINGKKITSVAWFKGNLTGDSDTFNKFKITITIYFYNKQGIAQSENVVFDLSDNHLLFDNESGWFIVKPIVCDVPTGTDEIMVQYSLSNRNSSNSAINCSGYVYFGGLLIDNLK